jgi:SnoaL-like domain
MEKKRLSLDDYIDLMKNCLNAWNNADPGKVADCYTEDLEYRDPTVPDGITNRADFIDYLRLIFKVWPIQEWIPKNIYPHAEEGSFSIDYAFKIANEKKTIRGNGMDRIVFHNEKIKLNYVYLNAEKWKDWIRYELKS